MKAAGFIASAIISISSFLFAAEPQKGSPLRLEPAQKILGADVPRLLCLDENFATGGQPTKRCLRQARCQRIYLGLEPADAGERVDLVKERVRVENGKLRYFNIPVDSSAPRAAQADEFLRITRNKANHPMLVTLRYRQSRRRLHDDSARCRTRVEQRKSAE
jgi:hypothetical protein